MKKIVCNDVSLYYRTAGEGEDIVLIHGLAANHSFWRFDLLLSLAKDYRVTIFDLRGHGYSDMPPSGYTSADMANDLFHLSKHLGITRTHLIGHSLGGVVALHYAVLYPDRVSSLVIADSRVRTFQPTNYVRDWPNGDQAIIKLHELGFSVPEDNPESGLWLLEELASPEWRRARQKLKGSSLFIPFGGWNGGQRTAERWLELLRTTTIKQDLTSLAGLTIERISMIRNPALAIYGEHSAAKASFFGLQDYLPNCKAEIVPRAGHFYPLTQPKLFANRIKQFLEELKEGN